MANHVWVLLTQPVVNDGDDTAWARVFSSRDNAIAYVTEGRGGPDLDWYVSEYNPNYQSAKYVDHHGETVEIMLYRVLVDDPDR